VAVRAVEAVPEDVVERVRHDFVTLARRDGSGMPGGEGFIRHGRTHGYNGSPTMS
jgi:hypothetical protein